MIQKYNYEDGEVEEVIWNPTIKYTYMNGEKIIKFNLYRNSFDFKLIFSADTRKLLDRDFESLRI